MEEIRIAHSPDSDDAFMFYGLASEKVDSGDLKFIHILKDIETLNRSALQGEYEVTAISIHAYPYVADKYILLPTGASMGDNYGPILVANRPLQSDDLLSVTVAVPGLMTSAYLALRLYQPLVNYVVLPFDEILPAVVNGKVDAGVIIHEGQLTYQEEGVHKVVDLGEWWYHETGLPLPLGGNVIRRDLGSMLIQTVSDKIRESIQYSIDHRQEALQYALQYGRGLDPEKADKFVGMYVNHWTLDYGEKGRQAVRLFLKKGYQAGIIEKEVEVEFVDG